MEVTLLDNLYYIGLTVGVASGLFLVLIGVSVKTAPQVDSKGLPEAVRGGCVMLAQGGAATAACIVLMRLTPYEYIKLINMYGPPFTYGLYLATTIVVTSPLVTAAALWYVRRTATYSLIRVR